MHMRRSVAAARYGHGVKSARQISPVSFERTSSTARSQQGRRSQPGSAVRGTTRLISANLPGPLPQARRPEPAAHGLGVIEHALMIIVIVALVLLVVGAASGFAHALWQNVSRGLSL